MKAVFKWWATLVLVAEIVQVGFAGYGAFFVAGALDGDGKTVDDNKYMDGFGLHSGFGYIVVLLGLILLVIGLIAGIGKWRLGRQGVLFLLLLLQVILAWVGFGVAAVGAFHPINALAIVGLTAAIVHSCWKGTGSETAPVAVA